MRSCMCQREAEAQITHSPQETLRFHRSIRRQRVANSRKARHAVRLIAVD